MALAVSAHMIYYMYLYRRNLWLKPLVLTSCTLSLFGLKNWFFLLDQQRKELFFAWFKLDSILFTTDVV